MKRIAMAALLFLALLAGCSSPGPKAENKETRPGTVEDAGNTLEPAGQAPPAQTRMTREALPASPTGAVPGRGASARETRTKSLVHSTTTDLQAARPALLPMVAAPAWNRESYDPRQETGFVNAARDPLSTFSIDVDTAGYANVRRFVQNGSLPPAGAVRIEEMVNAFAYDYPRPQGSEPLALSAEVGPSPFHRDYRLVRIGLSARDLAREELPPANLVFLVDVSGSMRDANKLPLLQQALALLVRQLGERDRVALVVYAGTDRVVLPPTAGNQQERILAAIDSLQAGGSTHGSSGIRTAYELARQSFQPGATNRVILASDGDFNVGVTSRDELQQLIEQERRHGVYLSVLGFGRGNYRDDTMELLADKGNGNYAYIDSLLEANRVLVREMSGTLFTLANDVKIQVEFNPARVGAYRLIGYENRALADEAFRDDTKDAGEVGVGHRVTALYELIPAGHAAVPRFDPLRYRQPAAEPAGGSTELLTVKLRYKPQGKTASTGMSLPVVDSDSGRNSVDFRFAAAVAGYGLLLIDSPHLGAFTWEQCLELARSGRGADPEGERAELYRMVAASRLLANRQNHGPQEETGTLPVLR